MTRVLAVVVLIGTVGCHAPMRGKGLFGPFRSSRVPAPGTNSYLTPKASSPYYQPSGSLGSNASAANPIASAVTNGGRETVTTSAGPISRTRFNTSNQPARAAATAGTTRQDEDLLRAVDLTTAAPRVPAGNAIARRQRQAPARPREPQSFVPPADVKVVPQTPPQRTALVVTPRAPGHVRTVSHTSSASQAPSQWRQRGK